MVQELNRTVVRPVVLDVRQRLQTRTGREGEHSHTARAFRVETAVAGGERMHYHRTTAGMSEMAPNRPGHRHRLPNGHWTDASLERWSSSGVGRL